MTESRASDGGSVQELAIRAGSAATWLAAADGDQKNHCLQCMAKELEHSSRDITSANGEDVLEAQSKGIGGAFLGRLALSKCKLTSMVEGLLDVVRFPDPVGRTLSAETRPNGLRVRKVSVPFGVVGIIYESRPDVTSDATALCFKAGNAVLLRGGSESRRTNLAIAEALRRGLQLGGAPMDCVQYVADPSRERVAEMLRAEGLIDLVIPRGGAGLIQMVVENARVPVIRTGTGNCHIYVHEHADLDAAKAIIVNAKCSNPGVCNAVETVLIDRAVTSRFVEDLTAALRSQGVEVRGCEEIAALVPHVTLADESDWATEYLDLILAIKVVDGMEEALRHIARYGTGHSEAIVTRDADVAARFQQAVDAACVYANASTRFTDGGQFGFGAEVGISTQKLHARGPLGLSELTTYKYLVDGTGQTRG